MDAKQFSSNSAPTEPKTTGGADHKASSLNRSLYPPNTAPPKPILAQTGSYLSKPKTKTITASSSNVPIKSTDGPLSSATTSINATTTEEKPKLKPFIAPFAAIATTSIDQQCIEMDAKQFSSNSAPTEPITTGGAVRKASSLNRSLYSPNTPPPKPISAQTASYLSKPKTKTITVSSSNVPIKLTDSPLSSATTSVNATTTEEKRKLKPGWAFIFNNEDFDNQGTRTGSTVDARSLEDTFDNYELNVETIKNATLSEIKNKIDQIKTMDYSDRSCLVIVILSHGGHHDKICSKDDEYIIDDTMLHPILENKSLKDKPKLFFVQACKGEFTMSFKDAAGERRINERRRPDEVLKCYCTYEGFAAYRLLNGQGSFFIQTLCKYLDSHGKTKDIRDIMQMVMLDAKELTEQVQMPFILSTLTQPYVFGDYVSNVVKYT